jgi:hypothetical protein
VLLITKPTRLNLGRLKKGQTPATKYISLSGNDKDKTKVTSVKAKNKDIQVEMNPAGFENDKDKQIKVTVLPGMKLGKFRDRVSVGTDHEKIDKLSFYVYGEIMGNITVQPNYLSFGVLKKGQKKEKKIILKSTSDAVFKVLEVTSTMPELATKLETIKEGKEYSITAFLNEGFSGNSLKGKVNIKTDDELQKNIEVKVFGRTAPKPSKKKIKIPDDEDDQKIPAKKKPE